MDQEWIAATDELRIAWLEKCRTAILEKDSQYGPFFVNQYSADKYLAALSMSHLRPDRENEVQLRVKEYHEKVKDQSSIEGYQSLNKDFPYIAFLNYGGQRRIMIKEGQCIPEPGLGVSVSLRLVNSW
jgi:hypothetical protein